MERTTAMSAPLPDTSKPVDVFRATFVTVIDAGRARSASQALEPQWRKGVAMRLRPLSGSPTSSNTLSQNSMMPRCDLAHHGGLANMIVIVGEGHRGPKEAWDRQCGEGQLERHPSLAVCLQLCTLLVWCGAGAVAGLQLAVSNKSSARSSSNGIGLGDDALRQDRTPCG